MLPGNRIIATSPQLEVTFIHAVTGKSYSQSVTGAFHSTVDGVGSTTFTSTGQGLLGDPTTGSCS